MALADYRPCDKCGAKAFYDARLNYEVTKDREEEHRVCGRPSHMKLENLGDWAVLCRDCAKTHRTAIVKREAWIDG